MQDLWGQMSGCGTLTSYILSKLCYNRIFILIVINTFHTTYLAIFCHWIQPGQNIGQVMTFFRKRAPTRRAQKVNIFEKITKFVEFTFSVCSTCVWLWACWWLLASFGISVIWFHYIIVKKSYLVARKTYEVKRTDGGVTFVRPYVITESSFV